MYHVFINNRKYTWCLLKLVYYIKISFLFLVAQVLQIFKTEFFILN